MQDGSDVIADYTQVGVGGLTLQAAYVQSISIDSKFARITGGTNAEHFYIPDALGSVTHLINSSQAIVNSEVTDAWGNVVASSSTVSDRHGFTQREKDTESWLMHYRARSYDPRLGRFVQTDPVRRNRPREHVPRNSAPPVHNPKRERIYTVDFAALNDADLTG